MIVGYVTFFDNEDSPDVWGAIRILRKAGYCVVLHPTDSEEEAEAKGIVDYLELSIDGDSDDEVDAVMDRVTDLVIPFGCCCGTFEYVEHIEQSR